MKGTVSICCFLYLLLLQATAGKNTYLVLCRVMHCEEYSCLCMAAPNDSIGDMVLVWREAGNATAVGWMVLHIQKQLFRLLQLSGVV